MICCALPQLTAATVCTKIDSATPNDLFSPVLVFCFPSLNPPCIPCCCFHLSLFKVGPCRLIKPQGTQFSINWELFFIINWLVCFCIVYLIALWQLLVCRAEWYHVVNKRVRKWREVFTTECFRTKENKDEPQSKYPIWKKRLKAWTSQVGYLCMHVRLWSTVACNVSLRLSVTTDQITKSH